MRQIIGFILFAVICLAGHAQIVWPPKALPCKVPFILSAEIQYYWEINQILCTGKNGSGYKFKVTGTGNHDHQAAQVNIMYMKPGSAGQLPEIKVAGTYYLPKVEKGKMFYFDFEAAWQGTTPDKFSLFFTSDVVILPDNPQWDDKPSNASKSTEPAKPYGNTDDLVNLDSPDLIVKEDNTIDKSLADIERSSYKPTSPIICLDPDTKAEFPGGEVEMMKWLGSHLIYPAAAENDNIQGRVIVEVIIDKDGKVVNPVVTRGRDVGLDKEALRLVKSLPTFIPAKKSGEPVNTKLIIPINFKIN